MELEDLLTLNVKEIHKYICNLESDNEKLKVLAGVAESIYIYYENQLD